MGKKIREKLERISDLLERVMAVIVLIAVAVAVISLWQPFLDFWDDRFSDGAFLLFMERILNIVIGVEFFKMLCKPGAETVMEVLMFCAARHMIVHDTSALENLLTILGIAVIILVKYLLKNTGVLRAGKRRRPAEQEDAE